MEKINPTLTVSATDVNIHDFYPWGWDPLFIYKYVTHPRLKKPLLQICASQVRTQGVLGPFWGGGGWGLSCLPEWLMMYGDTPTPCPENGHKFLEWRGKKEA